MTEAVATERVIRGPDVELVERARHGEVAAFEQLIRGRTERLLRLALSICGSEADARDALQEAFLRTWRDLPRLRDVDRFDAWLMRIVVNACRTASRRHRRSHAREIPVDLVAVGMEPSLPGPAERSSNRDVIRRAFARLDPDRRTILALHHIDMRSIADIADALGIPEGTAKWRLHAARSALARAIEEEEA